MASLRVARKPTHLLLLSSPRNYRKALFREEDCALIIKASVHCTLHGCSFFFQISSEFFLRSSPPVCLWAQHLSADVLRTYADFQRVLYSPPFWANSWIVEHSTLRILRYVIICQAKGRSIQPESYHRDCSLPIMSLWMLLLLFHGPILISSSKGTPIFDKTNQTIRPCNVLLTCAKSTNRVDPFPRKVDTFGIFAKTKSSSAKASGKIWP